MIKYKILSLFPEMFEGFKNSSIIGRAIKDNKIQVDVIDFRNYSDNKNRKVDDTIYGGGNGMLIGPESIDKAITDLNAENADFIYMSPRGEVLTENLAKQIASSNKDIVILCGHYEGVDERVLKMHNFREISIGDYVLTGGELPAMVLVDSTARLVDSVITKGSLENESFENSLLEHPQYTKPQNYKGFEVPSVLLSGNHQKIDEFRREESIYKTYKNRKDLLEKAIQNGIVTKQEIEKIVSKKEGN